MVPWEARRVRLVHSVARDTTDLEVDTGELVPLQGRVVEAAMDTGTPGVVGMR